MDKLVHGGDIAAAEKQFGVPAAPWLDLSTGISPWAWPVPALPARVWTALPYGQQQLIAAAAAYYRCPPEYILPVPGSQAAIRHLPQSLPTARVALPASGYREHARSWHDAGHKAVYYRDFAELRALVAAKQVDHAVLINPNNPSAETVSGNDVLQLHAQLEGRGLCLVDEAFADLRPAGSCAADCGREGLLVLRSFGKFFGLAGLRLGFLLGRGPGVARLQRDMEPWAVSHPAVWIGSRALADGDWQCHQRRRISAAADTLEKFLRSVFPHCTAHQAGLFVTLTGDREHLHKTFTHCGRRGLLLRYGELPEQRAWLRFGLPGEHLPRLEEVLQHR